MSTAAGSDDARGEDLPAVRPFLRNTGSTSRARHAAPVPAEPGPDPDEPAGEPTAPVLRPFVLTAGRVSADDPDIGLETQVTVCSGAQPHRLSREQQAIIALCSQPHSVAEISARLSLHLGVTRILVGDLRAAGQLDVHVMDDAFPDPDTIMRVIRGLQSLS